jgi:hypothetical protein
MSVVLIPGLIPCLALRWAMAPIAHKQKVRVSPRVYISILAQPSPSKPPLRWSHTSSVEGLLLTPPGAAFAALERPFKGRDGAPMRQRGRDTRS